MKYSNFISIILLLSVLGTACNKDDGSSQNNLINSNPIEGRWKVESFIKDNVNLTSQFNGYTFSCNSNGSLNINGNGDSFNCNWEWNNNNHEMCNTPYFLYQRGDLLS